MKNRFLKVLPVVISLVLISYVVYNIFNLIYDPVTTERAVKVNVDDSITVSGIVIRSEVLVDANKNGIVDYLVSDGDKVAKGETVANIYASTDGADIEEQLRATKSEIERVEAALSARGSGVDAGSVETNIMTGLSAFVDSCREGKLSDVDAAADEVLTSLNMRQVVQGNIDGFTARLEELKAKYSSLKNSRVGEYKSVSSPDAGYFVCYTDSLEGMTDYSKVLELTPAEIGELCQKTPEIKSDGIGKLIDEYQWYYVAPISAENAAKIAVGDVLDAGFSSFLSYSVSFKVEKLETDDDGNTAVIFSCNNTNSEIVCMRNDPATIRLNSYSGIRVNSDSLRVVDGVQGVYIARGQKVAFRQVDSIYLADGYIISKIRRDESEYLQLYDDIIIGGSDLYAGKLL